MGRKPLNFDKRVLTYFYVTKRLTMKAVAFKLDCHQLTVKKYLKLYGIPMRSRTGAPNNGNDIMAERAAPRRREMQRLYKSGLTLAEIAARYNLTRQRVHQIIHHTKKGL